MNENQDLLDLCRLNLIEEHIGQPQTSEETEIIKSIDWKKRNLAEKIAAMPLPEAPHE